MKRTVLAALIIVVSLCSCLPNGIIPPANLATVTDNLPVTPTQTALPPTPSSTSTPVLPVMQGTLYPLPGEILDPDNASRITLLARWDTLADTDQDRTIVSFSPDGTQLATESEGTLTIWDSVSGSLLSVSGDGKFLALSPDWSQIATRSTPEDHSAILLLDATSGQQLASWSFTDRHTTWPVFSPDGKMLAIFGEDVLQVCDTTNGNTLAVLQGDRRFQSRAVAFSQDGKKIVTTYQFMEDPKWQDPPPDGNIQVWDVASGTKVISYHVTEQNIYALAFSPDGTILAAMTPFQLILWDLTNGSLLKTMEPHTIAYYFAFTPSWKLMAVGGDIGGVVLLDPSTSTRMPQEPYLFVVSSLVFSPDGKRLAASDTDGSLFIWGVLP